MQRLFPYLLILALSLPSATAMALAETPSSAGFFYGHVASGGQPVKGAMVTFYHGEPIHSLTVFADEQGRFLSPDLPWEEGYRIRVRRVGWKDVMLEDQGPDPDGQWLDVKMERFEDPGEMIQKLPSNYWMNLVLEEFEDRDHLLEFKMQCTYCHQQGSPLTSRRNSSRSRGLVSTSVRAASSASITRLSPVSARARSSAWCSQVQADSC